MDFVAKSKVWLGKTIHSLKEKLLQILTVLLCFQQCRRKFLTRSQLRRHNRQLRKSTLATTDNSLKLSFEDGSPLPGISPLDDFHIGRPRPGDSSNSTTTEESASDDSLLGSPTVDQRNDRRLAQAELGLKGHDPRWNADDGNSILQVLDECKTKNVGNQSTVPISLTSQTCTNCLTDASVEDLRKLNQELVTQLQDSSQRILALERQLHQLQNPDSKSVLTIVNDFECISDQGQISPNSSSSGDCDSSDIKNEVIPSNSSVPLSHPPPPPPLPPPNWHLSTLNGASSKRRKSVPTPSCQLKTLNWIKLKEDSLAGTVWDGLEDESMYSMLDLKEIDKHFACASNSDPYGTIRSRMSVCSMIREISVLDARRAQNCAILLSKLKLSDREIKEAVLSLDSTDCIPKDMAEQLLKFIPTKEEIELLSPYANSKEVLHPADKFFIEISTIERYEQRLRCLCFKKSFKESIEENSKNITTIITASRRVLASKRLRKLLATILAIGNYLNQSKRSSDASGFHLSVLAALQDVKSSLSCDYTLMHFLVEFCRKSIPDVFGMLQETAVSMEAAKISGTDIQVDIEKLRGGLKLLAAELKASEKSNKGDQDLFTKVTTPLLAEYNESFSSMEFSFKEMKNAFAACCKAYAPEEHYAETLNVSEFFGYFAQFLNQFTLVETHIMRKRHEQEMRNLTLTRIKTKRQTTAASTHTPLFNCGQKSRKSGRVSKKAVTDVNEELLTSVLMAMDQRRSTRNGSVNEIILCGPRHRRSFRLSTKRKQLRSNNSLSNCGTLVRRRTPNQVSNGPQSIGECDVTMVEVQAEECDGAGHDMGKIEVDHNANRRQRSKNSGSVCRER